MKPISTFKTLIFILTSTILINSNFVCSFPFASLKKSNDTTPATAAAPPATTNSTTTTTTERPPNDVSILSLTPDVNHALTIDHQNTVINMGQSLSMGITNAITRPLTFLNNLIGSAAGSLPGIFAANGAALGTAIATPIQLGTLAANAAISGITGTVVSVPISLASGGAAQLVGLVGTGRQLWHSTIGSDPATSPFWANGELWLQPLALVTGANSIMAGISLQALSQGVKNLGLGIERFGVSLTDTGKHAKHLGSILVGWANGKPVYVPVVNDTKTNEVSVDLSSVWKLQPQNPIKVMANIDSDKLEIPVIEANKAASTILTTMIPDPTTVKSDGSSASTLAPTTTVAPKKKAPKLLNEINKLNKLNLNV